MMDNEEQIIVPESEQTVKPWGLFFNWFAANIGIMGIVYGALIVSYHLSFFQASLASLAGAFSFLIVGWVASIGKKTGITTFKMSRAAYGIQGNKIPNAIAWVNMVGWLAVNVVTGTLLLVSMFSVLHIKSSGLSMTVALIIFAVCVLLSGLVQEDTLQKVQTWISYIFGILTIFIMIFFVTETNWHQVLTMPSGNWISGFLPAVSIVAAGSGISWSMAAADWGAYVTPKASNRAVFWSTTLGGAVPLFVLMFAGVLLSSVEPTLGTSANPIDVMYHALPSWLGVVYFLVAAGGLVPQCIVSLRSARINLKTIGIRVSQKTSLVFHGIIVILIPIYILFVSENFLTNFQLFLGFLGICLAAWVAIFLCDSVFNRENGRAYDVNILKPCSKNQVNWRGVSSWIIAVIIGFLFTNNAVWTGPFAKGIFKDNSLGVFLSGILAIIVFWVINSIGREKSNHE